MGYLLVVTLAPPLLGRHALNSGYTTRDVFANYWLASLIMLPFVSVAALIAARRPDNRIGWLMLAGILLWNLSAICEAYADHPEAVTGSPGAAWLAWGDPWLSMPGALLIFFGLPLLFPTGRLPSPRWRAVGWLAAGATLLLMSATALGDDVASNERLPTAVRSDRLASWLGPLDVVAAVALTATAVGVVWSVIARFRHARGIERQQLKWFALVASLIVVGLLVSAPAWPVSAVGWYLALLGATLGLPVVIGLAILRYRLYAIDRIINRALVYGLLTAGLGALYIAGVVGLPRLLGPITGASDLVVAGSTLAVAALFRPARGRAQRIVDRRFYRRSYDAAKLVEVFSARLRDEVDLEMLVAELHAVVQETMQPAHVSLWLRPAAPAGDGFGDSR
jgi:hypothetical protein